MNRRDWLLTSASALSNWVCDCAALYACCRATGATVSPELALTAFVVGIGASSINILPGGLGTADAAMVVALRHGGLEGSEATVGVLLYRFVTLGLVVGAGWVVWLIINIVTHRSAPRDSVAQDVVHGADRLAT